jgi:hypothetical protein
MDCVGGCCYKPVLQASADAPKFAVGLYDLLVGCNSGARPRFTVAYRTTAVFNVINIRGLSCLSIPEAVSCRRVSSET